MPGQSTLEQLSDIDLVSAAREGDRRAYGELVCRYYNAVSRVVYRMCGDSQCADEAAQEAFIRAWQRLHQYKPQHLFRSWIFQIAINTAIDIRRGERAEVDIDTLVLASEAPSPEGRLEEQERAEAVRKAVMALPPASRAVVVLREYEGLAYQEIAAILGIPLGTVMSRLSYARSQMRQTLAAYLEGQ